MNNTGNETKQADWLIKIPIRLIKDPTISSTAFRLFIVISSLRVQRAIASRAMRSWLPSWVHKERWLCVRKEDGTAQTVRASGKELYLYQICRRSAEIISRLEQGRQCIATRQ